MSITPYLNLDGRAAEAMEFYKQAAGAEVVAVMKFSDAPGGSCAEGNFPESMADKVMHAEIKVGGSSLFLSDCNGTGNPSFKGISLALAVDGDAEAGKKFKALAAGGAVKMEMAPTFFASSFGTLVDKFGVEWMVLAPIPVPA